jgi:hypothetical protein
MSDYSFADLYLFYVLIYIVSQKSVNLKYSLLLVSMFSFKPASQFEERYHSVVSWALNMDSLTSNNFYKFSKQ